jgi:2-oxoisovalerate dehydrogenase E1 component
MPKNQFIDPKEVRKAGKIKFGTIPVNAYNKTHSQRKESHFQMRT